MPKSLINVHRRQTILTFTQGLQVILALCILALSMALSEQLSVYQTSAWYAQFRDAVALWDTPYLDSIVAERTDYCPPGSVSLISGVWPATRRGCYCQYQVNQTTKGVLQEGACTFQLLEEFGCVQVQPKNKTTIDWWKGVIFCGIRRNYSPMNMRGECRDCGGACIPLSDPCPANEYDPISKSFHFRQIITQQTLAPFMHFKLNSTVAYPMLNDQVVVSGQVMDEVGADEYVKRDVLRDGWTGAYFGGQKLQLVGQRLPVWRLRCQNTTALTLTQVVALYRLNEHLALSASATTLLILAVGWQIFSRLKLKESMWRLLQHLPIVVEAVGLGLAVRDQGDSALAVAMKCSDMTIVTQGELMLQKALRIWICLLVGHLLLLALSAGQIFYTRGQNNYQVNSEYSRQDTVESGDNLFCEKDLVLAQQNLVLDADILDESQFPFQPMPGKMGMECSVQEALQARQCQGEAFDLVEQVLT